MELDNTIRTRRSKGFIIFLVAVIVLSGGSSVLLWFIEKNIALAVAFQIFLAIFFVLACIVLLYHLLDYTMVKGDEISRRYFFSVKRAKIKDIDRLVKRKKDQMLYVYVNGVKFAALDPMQKETTYMLHRFEKYGVDTGKIIEK
ncbi:MAG: hypothetical protein K6F07_04000 [Bacilli bacterium]|nr:hypothetical protein [Bacilli bacterium]